MLYKVSKYYIITYIQNIHHTLQLLSMINVKIKFIVCSKYIVYLKCVYSLRFYLTHVNTCRPTETLICCDFSVTFLSHCPGQIWELMWKYLYCFKKRLSKMRLHNNWHRVKSYFDWRSVNLIVYITQVQLNKSQQHHFCNFHFICFLLRLQIFIHVSVTHFRNS